MKVFQPNICDSPGAAFGRRQQRRRFHLERLGQNHQFAIRDTTKLRFNFRERPATQIPAKNRAAGGKHSLRHLLLIAQLADLRTDDVLRFGHAPKMELDTTWDVRLNCSVFGAICSMATASRMKPLKTIARQCRNGAEGSRQSKSFGTAQTEIHLTVTGAPCGRFQNKSHSTKTR